MRITVEIWPSGNWAQAGELCDIRVANVSGLAPTSDYRCVMSTPSGRQWEFMILRHERQDGALALAARVLRAARTHARLADGSPAVLG